MNDYAYSDRFYAVQSRINELIAEYPNAAPIFDRAIYAAQYVDCEHPNIPKFIEYLSAAIRKAAFYNWHEGASAVTNRYCYLCGIDRKYLEAHLGRPYPWNVYWIK